MLLAIPIQLTQPEISVGSSFQRVDNFALRLRGKKSSRQFWRTMNCNLNKYQLMSHFRPIWVPRPKNEVCPQSNIWHTSSCRFRFWCKKNPSRSNWEKSVRKKWKLFQQFTYWLFWPMKNLFSEKTMGQVLLIYILNLANCRLKGLMEESEMKKNGEDWSWTSRRMIPASNCRHFLSLKTLM